MLDVIEIFNLLANFVMYAVGFVGGVMFTNGIIDRRAPRIFVGLLCIPLGVCAGLGIEHAGAMIAHGHGL